MGRYFGVANLTKGHSVSSYWKGCPPSGDDMERMEKIFGWDLENDLIISCSYCDNFEWDNGWDDFVMDFEITENEGEVRINNYTNDKTDILVNGKKKNFTLNQCIKLGFDFDDVSDDPKHNIEMAKLEFDSTFYFN